MINWWTIITIFFILALLDKSLTAINIIQVNKNFPDAVKEDKFKIERNPLARWFFHKFGLWGGSLAYLFIGTATMLIFFILIKQVLGDNVALYLTIILYGFVIFNNLYFLLKYSKIIP